MTGVAATSIMGETTSKAIGLGRKIYDYEWIKTFSNTRMVIVDEISFCTASQLGQLDHKLKLVKEEPHLTFGGVHVLFCGDFHQLPPIGGPAVSIWAQEHLLWHNVLNSFVELIGTWRFLEDPEWSEILGRIRMSRETAQDLKKIETCLIVEK
jgi:hypothetical protein